MKIEKSKGLERYNKVKRHQFIKGKNEHIHDDLLNQ